MRISDWSSDVCSSDLRRPNLNGLHTLLQRLHKPVVNIFGNDQAARSRAALAGRVKSAIQRAFDSHVQIGIVEHHQRIFAAHFKLPSYHAAYGSLRHLMTRSHTAREADSEVGRAH